MTVNIVLLHYTESNTGEKVMPKTFSFPFLRGTSIGLYRMGVWIHSSMLMQVYSIEGR
jgi:hypothetical protein